MRPLLRRLLYGLRTEGAGPSREAAAIGVGVFVGCSPFYGFHLLICWGLGTLLGLNRLKLYLAANVSNPIVAPFLLLGELQTGAWLRSGTVYPFAIQTLRTADPWVFGGDLLAGSLVVGGLLAALAAAVTYALVRDRSKDVLFAALVKRASDRYVSASIVGWEFAHGKLNSDPVYETVLGGELLPSGGTLVDIGCGQGLMLSLLAEAADAVRLNTWPATRTAPPVFDRLVGVELRRRQARLAEAALGTSAEILHADAGALPLTQYSAVLLFDVLHMMSAPRQEELLRRLSNALTPGGVMLVREADAAAGWRFTMVRMINFLQAIRVGSWKREVHYRRRHEWLACFERCGLAAEVCELRGGGTLGNVLFRVTR
ncbi:MAG: DUF2062 domain-containing protein [Vicinamibacterales bacterium]